MAKKIAYAECFCLNLQISLIVFLHLFLLQIIGFCIGVITPIRKFMVGNDAPFHVVEDSAAMLGYASQNLSFKFQDNKAKSCVDRGISFAINK